MQCMHSLLRKLLCAPGPKLGATVCFRISPFCCYLEEVHECAHGLTPIHGSFLCSELYNTSMENFFWIHDYNLLPVLKQLIL